MIRSALIFFSLVLAILSFCYAALIFLPTSAKNDFLRIFSQPRVDDHLEQLTEVGAFPPGTEEAYEHLINRVYHTQGLYFLVLVGALSAVLGLVFVLIAYVLYLSKHLRSLRKQFNESPITPG